MGYYLCPPLWGLSLHTAARSWRIPAVQISRFTVLPLPSGVTCKHRKFCRASRAAQRTSLLEHFCQGWVYQSFKPHTKKRKAFPLLDRMSEEKAFIFLHSCNSQGIAKQECKLKNNKKFFRWIVAGRSRFQTTTIARLSTVRGGIGLGFLSLSVFIFKLSSPPILLHDDIPAHTVAFCFPAAMLGHSLSQYAYLPAYCRASKGNGFYICPSC